MPATSEKQRRIMCLALSMKLGKTPTSKSPEAARMSREMSLKDLSDFCKGEVKE